MKNWFKYFVLLVALLLTFYLIDLFFSGMSYPSDITFIGSIIGLFFLAGFWFYIINKI